MTVKYVYSYTYKAKSSKIYKKKYFDQFDQFKYFFPKYSRQSTMPPLGWMCIDIVVRVFMFASAFVYKQKVR